MKKLLLLPVLIFFAACSTDTDNASQASINVTTDNALHKGRISPECGFSVTGSLFADVTNGGIQNPVIMFSAVVSGTYPVTQYYRTTLILETLLDCEDINSGSGIITTYELPAAKDPMINVPTVSIQGSQLPANGCYRWRFLVEQVSTPTALPTCIKYSQWYDAPLF